MAAVLFWSNLCREAWGLRRLKRIDQRVLPMPKYPSGAAESADGFPTDSTHAFPRAVGPYFGRASLIDRTYSGCQWAATALMLRVVLPGLVRSITLIATLWRSFP